MSNGKIYHMEYKGAQASAKMTVTAARLFGSTARPRISHGIPGGATQARHVQTTVQRRRPNSPAGREGAQLHVVLEREARRIAQSLHDEAGQLLAAVHLKLDELSGKLPEGRERILELKGLLTQMEEQLRRMAHELRPTILDDLGVVPAVEFLRQGVAKRTGLSIVLEGSIPGRLPPVIETALYRIVHEVLGNIANHARARRVRIVFRKDDRIHCTVHDDGIGFNPVRVLSQEGWRGLGLAGIRERVADLCGTLAIESSPGCGTRLVVSIPLK